MSQDHKDRPQSDDDHPVIGSAAEVTPSPRSDADVTPPPRDTEQPKDESDTSGSE